MAFSSNAGPGAVRFSDTTEEIAAPPNYQFDGTSGGPNVPPEMAAQLRNLSASMQSSRLANYNFEPVSLPPSRVCLISVQTECFCQIL